MWDERYSQPGYLFGTEPAAFLERETGVIPPGASVLAVADGEGRNSVWLARQGLRVTAFDASPVAVGKARTLAAKAGADLTFHVADVQGWAWDDAEYDAVVAVFVQFADPSLRARMFADMARTLRPGGLLLLHGYAPRQVGYGTGGPPDAANMYTLELLHEAFAGWEVLRSADYDSVIEEGRGHSGISALIDFIARKPGLAPGGARG